MEEVGEMALDDCLERDWTEGLRWEKLRVGWGLVQ